MPKNYKYYNPLKFNVNAYSPALWLDAADRSTLIMDGARTFASASSQFLSVSNNSTHAPAANLMVGCWVKLTSLPSLATNMRVISRWLTTGNQRSYDLVLQNVGGVINFAFLASNSGTAVDSQATNTLVPTTGTWYFVVGWWTGTTLYCSVNAGTPASTACATIYNSTAALLFGAREGGADYLNGSMDSAFLFKAPTSLGDGTAGSLAKTLIDYLYNSGSGRRSSDFILSAYYSGSGAVSWWDMDARSGNETDRIGSNNLTNNGGVGYAAGVASGLVQYTGDPVKQWSDKSGNARHVTAASDAVRPVYDTSGAGGLPVVTFDGLDDYLQTAANFGTDTGLSGNPAFTVFWVSKKTLVTKGHILGWGNSGGTLTASGFYDDNTGKSWGYAGTNSYVHIGVANNTWLVHSYRKTAGQISTTSTLRMNGVDAAAGSGHSTSTPNITGTYSLAIGRWGSLAGALLQGSLAEILIYPSALTDAQTVQVERYLGNKWGITVA